jgi:hypothetical protein
VTGHNNTPTTGRGAAAPTRDAIVSRYSAALLPQHAQMLAESGITPEHARARSYVSVDTKKRLEQVGVTKAGRKVPGLLIPLLGIDGSTWGYQYRPDHPRLNGKGKPIKYETPVSQRNGIDVPPGVGDQLDDPKVPLWITEGTKKADAGAVAGLCIVALPGVWGWRGSNEHGGKVAVPDWHDVALNDRRVILAFDSDVVRKKPVRLALGHLAAYLRSKGATVQYLHLPDDDEAKTGLDDYLADGHTTADLWRLVKPDPPATVEDTPEAVPVIPQPQPRAVTPQTLEQVRTTFAKWLGADYDLTVLDVVLAVAASERLTGDPAWLLVVSGPGAAKTETVGPLAGAGAHVTSTINSEGALLSGTSNKERSKDATGGLLRKVGSSGILVIKDVTSILSMNRDARGGVLAALREVYDGLWERNLGVDGGQSLRWTGRLVVIGAVTTAWDKAHGVISSMGDRFILVRLDSTTGRMSAGRQAIRNTGSEVAMRAELADAVAGLLGHVHDGADELTDGEADVLLALADVVTLARTGVERDYRGDVIDAHAPEMPTRFAKQLTQVVRGALALGMPRTHALALAQRCAADSVPPLRLAVLLDLLEDPDTTTTHAVRKRLDRPRATVDRELQALHMLGLLTVDEVETVNGKGVTTSVWHYALSDLADRNALRLLGSARNVITRGVGVKKEVDADAPRGGSDISGTTRACTGCGNTLGTADPADTCGWCEMEAS